MVRQPAGVAGGGGGIAADHHHRAGCHLYNSGQGCLITALAGRVHHNYIRVLPFGSKGGCRLPGILTAKIRLVGGKPQPRRGFLGALHGLGYDLHAQQTSAIRQHRKPDRTHTAVQIQQKIIGTQRGIFPRLGIQHLGGGGVDLIKLMHAHLQGNPCQRVADKAAAQHRAGLPAQNHVGAGGVLVDQNGGQRKFRLQRFAHLPLAGQGSAVQHKAQKAFAAVPALPHIQVAHQPRVGFFVVSRCACLLQQGAGALGKAVHPFGLQLAILAQHNAVAAPGVKACDEMPAFIASHGQLYLVTVTVCVFGTDNRQHRHIQAPQPGKGVLHKARLCLTLGGIFQVPQPAAAAGGCHGAIGRTPPCAGGQQLFQPGKGIAFHRLDNAHLGNIAGRGIGDKQRHTVLMGNAVAVTGQGFNFYGQNLVFRK